MLDTARAEHFKLDVAEINAALKNSPDDLIEKAEKRYNEQIEFVTEQVIKRKSPVLMVSGPSGSTKTTSSNKIAGLLGERGVHSIVISMDDFFINRADLPLLEDGEPDFESVATLDLVELNRCMEELSQKGYCEFPIFDFKRGKRREIRRRIEVNSNSLVIMEGIHALNPTVLSEKNKSKCSSLYVSAHSDFYLDGKEIMTARKLRFIRRVVRDYFYRGNSISGTIKMWDNVVKGEIVNIMPFRPEADFKIDSTILYEPCIYRHYLNLLLEKSELKPHENDFMDEVFEAISYFEEMDLNLVPKNTVIREFIM